MALRRGRWIACLQKRRLQEKTQFLDQYVCMRGLRERERSMNKHGNRDGAIEAGKDNEDNHELARIRAKVDVKRREA